MNLILFVTDKDEQNCNIVRNALESAGLLFTEQPLENFNYGSVDSAPILQIEYNDGGINFCITPDQVIKWIAANQGDEQNESTNS